MSKILIALIVIVIAVLVVSDVIEVKVHQDKLVSLPSATISLLTDKTVLEKTRVFSVGLKRRAEQLVLRDKEKQLELTLLYVKTDATRLQELIDEETSTASLLPQAEMLISSIEQVRTRAEEAPIEIVAGLKEESTQAFARAQQALGDLQEQNEELESVQQEFTRLTEALEEQIGKLDLESAKKIGDNDDQEADEAIIEAAADEESEQSDIPLKF